MITNYLKELLNDNECVIIPEFGAFISKRHSATIDYANNRFLPPYKEIVFNDKLKNDDGILVNFIATKENISNEDSLTKIQSFVNQSVATLDVDFELELPSFGKIININGNYIFNVKEDINVLGDSFGLTEFNYQPVFRTETYQIIKEKIVVEQKEKNTDYTLAVESVQEVTNVPVKRRPSLFKTLTYTTLAFLLIFAINWTTDKSDSNLASWNPFLYSSPNEFLIKAQMQSLRQQDNEATRQQDNKTTSQQDNEPSTSSGFESVAEPTEPTVNIQSSESMSESVSMSEPHYYIIGGSFQTEASAEKCLNGIKNQGFEKAATLDKNDKGYIRVYYESFADKADALIRLNEIKNEYNESAWLLFQK